MAATKSVEFLHGWRHANGDHYSAIRIVLEPGWKTYWRAPQGAGIPPMLSVDRNNGIRDVQLVYPKPNLYVEFGEEVLGYTKEVTFPIIFDLERGTGRVVLDGEFRFAVCKDVCIPMVFNITTNLHSEIEKDVPAIRAAMKKGPANASSHNLKVHSCSLRPSGKFADYNAALSLPSGMNIEKVIVEYATDSIWVAPAEHSIKSGQLNVSTRMKSYSTKPTIYQRDSLRLSVLTRDYIFEFSGC